MAYSFFLDGVLLPVTPSKMSLRVSNQNKTINLINHGEVNILKAPGLTEITFDVLIPQVKYPFAVYPEGFKDATFYLDIFEKLKVNMKPFQFICSRVSPNGNLLFDTNMTVSLEEYSIDEDSENGLDLIVSVTLKQYRSYGTKKVVLAQSNTNQQNKTVKVTTTRASAKTAPKTYTVVRGDTLWAICKKHYGKATKAMTDEIAKKNNIKNPNLIYPGQVIKLG